MPRKDEVVHPGAGTLFVHGETRPPALDCAWQDFVSGNARHGGSARGGRHPGQQSSGSLTSQPVTAPELVPSPDALLHRGIADYTFVPQSEGGVLGRGKFSTVYKVVCDGQPYALKHTALYPHHPLISARLLREPTLLAQLPPHPCLIGVDGWVRTDGHFYLIEQYATSHVPLPAHPLPLAPSRAAYILDQLVSVVRDGLHEGGRVCHRDIKGENVLVDAATGDILVLDLGLATHYSAREPKLTTCCGSPAFHAPEIVHALSRPPGEVTYYGPELDIWCIALTMLALLTQTRFPLGPTHTSRYVMAERARDRLQELDELYPPDAPHRALGPAARRLGDDDRRREAHAWARVRRAMRDFLEMDACRRMDAFAAYDVGDRVRARVERHRARDGVAEFKSTSFVATDVKYTLPLALDAGAPVHGHDGGGGGAAPGPLVLRNPSGESERRVVSYVKYLLRSSGILYHHIPHTSPAFLQLVVPLAPPSPPSSFQIPAPIAHGAAAMDTPETATGNWVSNLLSLGRGKHPARSASVPPRQADRTTSAPAASAKGKGKHQWAQTCWMRIDVERGSPRDASRAPSRAGSASVSRHGSISRASSRARQRSGDSVQFSPVQEKASLAPPLLDGFTPLSDAQTTAAPPAVGGPLPGRPPMGRVASARATVPAPRADRRDEPHLSPLSRQVSPRLPSEHGSPDGASATLSAVASPTPSMLLARPPALRRSTSASIRTTTTSSTARRAPSRRPTAPSVLVTLSEPRAYDLVRAALDVRHVDSPVTYTSLASRGSSSRAAAGGRGGVRIPTLSGSETDSAGGDGRSRSGDGDADGDRSTEADSADAEEERGRPRSKESSGMAGGGGGGDRSVTVKPKAVSSKDYAAGDASDGASRDERVPRSAKGIGLGVRAALPSPSRNRRDGSRVRSGIWETLFGKGVGVMASDDQVGTPAMARRSSSVPAV